MDWDQNITASTSDRCALIIDHSHKPNQFIDATKMNLVNFLNVPPLPLYLSFWIATVYCKQPHFDKRKRYKNVELKDD